MSQETATVPYPAEFFNDLPTRSLQQLGCAIAICTSDRHDQVCRELERRVEHSLTKAEGLYDYHAATFKKAPSAKNWNEMSAIMALVQYMVNES